MKPFPPAAEILASPEARRALADGILRHKPLTRPTWNRTPRIIGCDLPEVSAPRTRIAGMELFLVYESASGVVTERSVTLRGAGKGDHASVYAFCHLRNGLRHFLVERIIEAVDPHTGEVLECPRWFLDLLRRGYHVQRADIEDFVRVLVFMAYCDSHLAPEEIGAIDDAISRYCLRMDGTDEDFEQACAFARRAAIEGIDFMKAISNLLHQPNAVTIARLLHQSLKDIAEADYEVYPEEQHWLDLVRATIYDVAKL